MIPFRTCVYILFTAIIFRSKVPASVFYGSLSRDTFAKSHLSIPLLPHVHIPQSGVIIHVQRDITVFKTAKYCNQHGKKVSFLCNVHHPKFVCAILSGGSQEDYVVYILNPLVSTIYECIQQVCGIARGNVR
jgi:hypothetical protein